MIINYLKIALRSLWKHKGFALINITGLALAILCTQMIYLYVQNENTYDRFHGNAKNIYRVVTDFKFNDVLDHLALSPPPLASALKADYPEIEKVTQLTQYNQGKTLLKTGNKKIYLDNIFFADSDFFNIFSYTVLKGNIRSALTAPNCVVLTERTAQLYFGDAEALGKTLEFDLNDGTFAPYKITAIIKDPPKNSHLKFTALTSMPGLWNIYPKEVKQSWVSAFMYTYMTLKNGTDHHALQSKIKGLYERKSASISEGVKASCDFIIEPLTDIHLRSKRIWDVGVQGNANYINIFILVAIFILLLASINYINLSTARAASRMKEMGIRKVAGATRFQLMMQIITEVVLIAFIAAIIAYLLAFVCIGFLSRLTGIPFDIRDLLTSEMLMTTLGLTLLVSLISGIYPGFYISNFNPAHVLKSKLSELNQRAKWKGFTFRKLLVVFQFSISMIMIVSTIIVYRQLHYMLEKDPGFNRDRIVSVMLQDTMVASKFNALKGELLKLPVIKGVTYSATIPGGPPDRKITRVEGKTPSELVEIPTQPVFMDFNYPQLMEFKLKEGEFIKEDSGIGFRNAFMVNEAAVEKFGWKEPLGKRIVYGFNPQNIRDGKVVGVLKNIQTVSFKEQVEPMIFMVYKRPYAQTFVTIKLSGDDMLASMNAMENVFNKFDPVHPFDPIILDESIRKLYEAEIKMSRLFTIFSGLPLLIACMGLLGLASFVTEQRTKEIGVRKVLGASVGRIVLLVSKDFAWLLLIAFVVAVPVSWFAMQYWLKDFATRIEIHFSIFILSAIVTCLVAGLTISFQTIKAAAFSPIRSLRYE